MEVVEKWGCLYEDVFVDCLGIVMRMDIGRLGESKGSLYTTQWQDSQAEDSTSD